LLLGAVSTMLCEVGADEEMYAWMRSDQVNVGKNKEVYKWLGQRAHLEGIEAPRMFHVFRIYEGQKKKTN
jgi:hypothetical protein